MNAVGPRYRWFLAAGVVLVLTGAAHLAAFLNEPAPATDDERALFRLLDEVKFALPGATRSTHELSDGFHLFFVVGAIALGLAAIVLATAPDRGPILLTRVRAVYALFLVGFLAISLACWFVIPTSFAALALFFVAVSFGRDGRAALSRESGLG